MVQLKAHVEYLHAYHEDAARTQSRVNRWLAVLSGLGLALWVVLEEAAEPWAALVIVLTAIFHAITPYMPYQRRIRDTADLKAELQGQLLQAERRWYDVSEGLLENRQINQLTIDLREQKDTLERAHFKASPLPRNAKHLAIAAGETKLYFNTHYRTGRLHVQDRNLE